MAARFAAEKGVEVLLDALPAILEKYPQAQVLFAGQYQNVMGEQAYAGGLCRASVNIEEAGHWKFLGNLKPASNGGILSQPGCAGRPLLELDRSFWSGADRGHDE